MSSLRFTEEVDKEILRLHHKGYSSKDIARYYNVSNHTDIRKRINMLTGNNILRRERAARLRLPGIDKE